MKELLNLINIISDLPENEREARMMELFGDKQTRWAVIDSLFSLDIKESVKEIIKRRMG